MAEPWWKRAAGAFLEPALFNCCRARDHLGAALRDLESEELLHTRDAAGRYVLLDSAARSVEQVSWFLAISMGAMVGVELLALRGCGPDPTHPVASVDHTRDARHGMWLTLARLRSARADGQVVLRAAEAAVGHLQAAQFMATRRPAPGCRTARRHGGPGPRRRQQNPSPETPHAQHVLPGRLHRRARRPHPLDVTHSLG
jgi:hypothetical protein